MKSLQEIIDGAKRLVFFGGAGVSTSVGKKTAQEEEKKTGLAGLWERLFG